MFGVVRAAVFAVAAFGLLTGCWSPAGAGTDTWNFHVYVNVWNRSIPRGQPGVQVQIDTDKTDSHGEVLPGTGYRVYYTSNSSGDCEDWFTYDMAYKNGIYTEDIRIIAQCTYGGKLSCDTVTNVLGFRGGAPAKAVRLTLYVSDSTVLGHVPECRTATTHY
jgi:hypothetical protein